MESTFRRLELKSDYLKMTVNLVQYRGAVGNFNNQKFFNTKAKYKVFAQRYWIPINSGAVLLLLTITQVLCYTKVAKLKKISVLVDFFSISSEF